MKHKIKIALETLIIVILTTVLVASGIAVFRQNKKGEKISGNPLDWSVDVWDGASIGNEEYLADYANRGKDSITIESAESFMYFISQVNSGNSFDGCTVYLNSNLDLAGYTIDSIGDSQNPFKGTFDGSYYTVMNANVVGNGLFDYTENAVIKNLGLYNINVTSTSVYAGGLIGHSYNTTIENSFFRLGSVKGVSYVGGLVGLFEAEEDVVTISNSFVDSTLNGVSVGGLIGGIRTHGTDSSLVKLEEVYYTSGTVYAEIDSPSNYIQTKVIKPTSISNFSGWDYGVKNSKWAKYDYAENSNKLKFNYPILNQFVKVYTLGACYENVLYDPSTGEVENVESLTKALESANDLRKAEINIIVSKVTLDKTATLSGTTQLKINATKDTIITRGDNKEALIKGVDHTRIVLGDNSSDAKIVIDGNRKIVENNKLKSGALIEANSIEINQNVVLQNNINNVGNGGAIVLTNNNDITLKGIEINNCKAQKGGAIYVTSESVSSVLSISRLQNITIDDSVVITNCTAEKGGALYVDGNVNLIISDNIYGNNASVGKDIYFENKSTITLQKDLTNELSVYINGLKPYEETGRTNFDYTTVCYGDNLSNNIDKIILENEGLKTTNVLKDNVVSAYNGTEYNITYNTNGGTHSNPETYTCVDNIVFGEATKKGYDFLGWKEVKETALLASNLEEEYATEITTGTLGNKEYEAEYQLANDGAYFVFAFHDNSNRDVDGYFEDVTKEMEWISASGNVFTFDFEITVKDGYLLNDGIFYIKTDARMTWLDEINSTIQSITTTDNKTYTVSCVMAVNDKFEWGTPTTSVVGREYVVIYFRCPVTVRSYGIDYNNPTITGQTSTGIDFANYVSYEAQPQTANYNENITITVCINQDSNYDEYAIADVTLYLKNAVGTILTRTQNYSDGYIRSNNEITLTFNMSNTGSYADWLYFYVELEIRRTVYVTFELDETNNTTGKFTDFSFNRDSAYVVTGENFIFSWWFTPNKQYSISTRCFSIINATAYNFYSINDPENNPNIENKNWACNVEPIYKNCNIILTINLAPAVENGDNVSTATVNYNETVDSHVTFNWINKPTTVTAGSTVTFSWSTTVASGFKISSTTIEILSRNSFSYTYGSVGVTGADSYTWSVPDGVDPPRLTREITVRIVIRAQDISVTSEEFFEFSEYKSGYSVRKKEGVTLPEDVIIPKTYNGKPILAIVGLQEDDDYTLPAFTGSDVKTIVVPDTVTYIGDWAFGWCESLTSINIPSGVTYIGRRAFIRCNNLESINIPSVTTSIGEQAFLSCQSLTAINVDAGNPNYASVDGVLMTKDKKTIIAYPGCKESTAENPYTIPSSVTTISEYAFSYSSGLEYLVVPNTITALDRYAFECCYNMKHVVWNAKNLTWDDHYKNPHWFDECGRDSEKFEVIINEDVTNFAFANAYISHLTINKNVTFIGAAAFGYGYKLIYLYYDAVNPTISNSWSYPYEDGVWRSHDEPAFDTISDEGIDIVIGPNTKVIPSYFMYFSYEYWHTYEYEVDGGTRYESYLDTEYGPSCRYVYNNSTGTHSYYQLLNSLDLSNATSLIKIGAYAFTNCKKITDLVIPENVMYIDQQAFYGCEGLLSQNGGSVTFEKLNGWRYMDSMYDYSKSMSLPGLTAENVDTYLTNDYGKQFWINDPYWFLEFSRTDYYDNTLNYYTITKAYKAEDVTSLVLPETRFDLRTMTEYPVKRIGDMELDSRYSWDNTCIGVALPNLTEVTIPACYEYVGKYAFANASNLKTVTFNEESTLQYIYEYVFYNCSSITSITLPTTIKCIDEYAFAYAFNGANLDFSKCTNLTTIYPWAFYNANMQTIKLPSSITLLREKAFDSSGLIEFDFTELVNLTDIADGLLSGCTKLETLTISKNITSIGWRAFAGCTSLTTLNWNTNPYSVNYSTNYNRHIFSGSGAPTGINIKIGENVQTIPQFFMYDGYNAKHIKVASIDFSNATALASIGTYAFYYNTIAGELNFNSNKAITINKSAFYNCVNLTKISGNIGVIGESGFESCDNLVEVDLSNLITIEAYGLRFNEKLATVNIPKVITIGNSAFDNCTDLSTVYSQNIESIGVYAFEDCSNLTHFYALPGTWYRGSTYIGEYGGDTIEDANELAEEYANELAEMVLNYYKYELYRKKLFNYELTDDHNAYVIWAGNDINDVSSITIPSTYNGKPITAIQADGFKGCTTLTSVTIPTSITEIGDSAFYGCNKLRTVNIGINVTKIGEKAFYGCYINSINIPASVIFIGKQVFDSMVDGCFMYATFVDANYWTVNNTILAYDSLATRLTAAKYLRNDYVKYEWIKTNTELIFTEVTNGITKTYNVSINPIFKEIVENIEIPSSYNGKNVTGVSASGFKDCINLKSIVIPSTITSIGNNGFQGCVALISIDLNSVSSLGTHAFDGCTSLSSVDTSSCTFTSIPNYAFQNCTALSYFELPNSVTTINQYAFAGSGLTSFDTNKVTTMYKNAFDGCNITGEFVFNTALKTFAKVTGEESNVLFKDATINTVAFNRNILSTTLLKDNKGISNVVFNFTLSTFPEEVFSGCTSLKTVTLNYVTDIDVYAYAFYGCTSLTTFICKYNNSREASFFNLIRGVGGYAFAKTGLEEVVIGENFSYRNTVSTGSKGIFSDCTNLKTVIFNSQKISFINQEMFMGCSSLTSVDLTNTKIKSIEKNAFKDCNSLTTFTYPSTLNNIKDYAFYNCGFVNYVAPSTVTSFGQYAYSNNSKLQSVDFSQSSLKIFPAKLFTDCTNLSTVTLGASLTTIDAEAFSGCSKLTHIDIPDSVYRIGKNAFAGTGLLTANFKHDENTNWAGSTSSNYTNGVLVPHDLIDTESDRAKVLSDTYAEYYLYSADQLAYYEVKDGFGTVIGYAVGIGSGVDGSHLTNINIPDTHNNLPIVEIYYEGFEGCENLVEINIPSTVTEIQTYAFNQCSKLNLDLSQLANLKKISNYAFRNCDSLPSTLNLPSSLMNIENDAFWSCDSITTVNINKYIQSIGTSAFGCCSKLTTINVDEDNANYSDDSSKALYNKDKTTILQYAIGITNSSYSLLTTTNRIGSYSFAYAKNLTTLNSADNFKSLESIGSYAFTYCTKLRTFDISSNTILKTISDYAFYGCSNLTAFKLSENSELKTIGEYAFADCDLYTIIIPENVTSLGIYAYSGNNYTSYIKYYAKNAYLNGEDEYGFDGHQFAYVGKNSSVSVTIGAQVEHIPAFLFLTSTSYSDTTSTSIGSINPRIYSITFEEGCVCTSIGQYAFRFLKKLWYINLDDLTNLTTIGKWAFKGDIALSSLTLPESVSSIDTQAFAYCNALSTVSLPASLSYIGSGAFEYCNNLDNVYFGNAYNWVAGSTSLSSDSLSDSSVASTYLRTDYRNVSWYKEHDYLIFEQNTVSINRAVSNYNARTLVEIPSSFNGYTITHIKGSGFEGMTNLQKVVLPSTITHVGARAFLGCTALTSINLSKVVYINARAFDGCTSLNTIDLSNLVTIYENAFQGCSSLTSLDLPKVEYIYTGAFEGCSSLTNLDLPKVQYIDTGAFKNCSGLISVNIGSYLSNFEVTAFEGCAALTAINVNENNVAYCSVDGVLFNKGKTSLLFYPANKVGERYEIPNLVHTIDSYAFSDTNNLTTLKLSGALIRIGQYAFKSSSVTTLENLDPIIPWYCTTNSNYVEGFKVTTFNVNYLKNNSDRYYYRNDTDIFYFHNVSEVGGWTISIKDEFRDEVTSIIIPSYYAGYWNDIDSQYSGWYEAPVISISDFRKCENLEYVYIPNTIAEFKGVQIYENKEWKYYGSFEGCTNLKTIYIDSNFTSDDGFENGYTGFLPYGGVDTFKDCGTKTDDGVEIIFSENITLIPCAMFQIINSEEEKTPTTANITKVTYLGQNDLKIGDYAFAGLSTLTEFVGFEHVTSVGAHAFDGCTNLANVDLSKPTTIGAYAFNNCSSLTEVNISAGNIGEYAFANCVGITELNLISNSIGERAFTNCTGVTNLYVNSAMIGEAAFSGCNGVCELTIGEKVKSLPNAVFAEMTRLTTINFNATNLDNYSNDTTVAQIMRGLPANNYVLSNAGRQSGGITLNIGPNVIRIPANMFSPTTGGGFAPNITSIVWSENSKCAVIGNGGFRWLKTLTEVTIPESIQYIGDLAFYDCVNISTINFNAVNCYGLNEYSYGDSNTWGVSNYAFHNVGKAPYETKGVGVTVNIGNSVTRIPANLFHSTRADYGFTIRLTELNVDNATRLKEIGENALYNAYYLKSITIPESVTTIGKYAFYNAINITSFNFNAINMNDLEDLNYTFSRLARNVSNGIDVVIGQNVRHIPAYLMCPYSTDNSFKPNVKSVIFGDGSNVETIGKYAFRYCEDMLSVDLENCINLTTIGDWAFRGCINLKEIYIPKSIKTLGNYAFAFTYKVNKITFDASYMNDLTEQNYVFQDAGLQNGTSEIDVVMGYNVRYVPSWLFVSAKSQIKTITFSEKRPYWNITFKQNSLRGLNNVEELEIPSHTGTIQPNAFYGMTGLKKIYFNAKSMNDLVNIDGDVTKPNAAFAYVGNKVFYSDYENANLTKTGNGTIVYIGANVERLPASLFFTSTSNDEKIIPKITSVIFEGNKITGRNFSHRVFDRLLFLKAVENLEDLDIERIGDYAFNQCLELTDITLPASLQNIGLSAFRSCKALTKDLLADTPNLRRINNYAFYGCESLTEITIPEDVNYIHNNAFENCYKLSKINWNATLEKYDELYISENNLKSLKPDENIFTNAGRDAEGLEFVTNENVEYVPAQLFNGCEYLTEATLTNIWEIGEYAFYGSGLKTLSIMEGDWMAKKGNQVLYIQINGPKTLTKTNNEDSNCYADYTISNELQYVFTLNNDKSSYSVRAGRGLASLTHADIPSEYEGYPVTHIEENGFADFSELNEITIPESITSIGYNAFANCPNLIIINYNAINVTSNGTNLFYNSGTNRGLTLNIGENVESIPNNFLENSLYESWTIVEPSNVSEIVFKGNKLKHIGTRAFAGCANLISLTIPDSVTYIGSDLFYLNNTAFDTEILYYIDNLMLTFQNTYGWYLVNDYGSKKVLDSDFFSDSNSILSKFIILNSYEYNGSENYWDNYGYAFERGSDEIEFILDHGENAISETKAIYYSRYNSLYWYADKSLSEESIINKVEIPENADEELVFMGYYYGEVQIIDGHGNIVKDDITSLINMEDFNNSYTLVAKWDKMEASLSVDVTTIEYDSAERSVLTVKVINKDGIDIKNIYELETTYAWYRNGVVIDGINSSSYIHASTTAGVGTYRYYVEVSLLGEIFISNEIVVEVTYGLLDKPTLSPTTYEFDGNAHIPTISGFDETKMEYDENYPLVSKTEVGVYVVRIQLKNNYAWKTDEGYNRDYVDLMWSITGFKVTLKVDDTYNAGKLSYTIGNNEYSSDSNNEFTVRSRTTTIKATANTGYGFYYYTIVGNKTNKTTTVYNTKDNEYIRFADNNDVMFVAQFDLENITEDVTVTGYFAPVITLSIKVEKEKEGQGLKSYKGLITSYNANVLGNPMNSIYTTDTDKDTLEAIVNVFVDKDMIYDFKGTSDEVVGTLKDSYDVISTLKFAGTDILIGATMNIENTSYAFGDLIRLVDDFVVVAGGNYEVVYEIIEVVSVKDVESKNELANIVVTPTNPSEGVRIEGDMYVKPEAKVGISVINIAEGYTFVGFKSGTSSVYLYNDPNLGYQEGTNGAYNYSFSIKNSMSALVVKNFTDLNKIDVNITTSATLQLTHNSTLLKYSLDNSGISYDNSFASMMQGEYTLSGLTAGTVTIKVYNASGTEISSKTITTNQSYTFTIDDTTTNVSIIVE